MHPQGTARESGSALPGAAWTIALTAAVVVALAAWRSTLGMSFLDDGYYAAATLRMAQGARLFGDEMYTQSLGFFAAVPFAKAWTSLFGMTGFVVALRLFYVALAGVAAVVVYRALRPSFGRWAAFAGAAVPFLAPAYNLLAVSYNTMAVLGMALAVAASFAALRDRSPAAAVAAGAAAAFAAISYPPLAVAGVALLVTLAFTGRDRRLTGAMAAGAAAVVVTFGVWLLARTSMTEIGLTYDYVVGAYAVTGPGGRLAYPFGKLWEVLTRAGGLPIWAWLVPLAVGLATTLLLRHAPRRERLRGWVVAVLPLALVAPVLANWSATGRGASLETVGGNYLIAFVLFALPGVALRIREGASEIRSLLVLALPAGIAGFVVVTVSTSAGLDRASGVVGLAPLALAAVVWWAVEVRRLAGPRVETAAVVTLVLAFVVLLFGSSFADEPPLTLRHTIRSGSYAGVTTSGAAAARVSAIERLTARWVSPSTTVLFVREPGAYVLQPGVMLTNAVWLDTGPVDRATVDYFGRIGRWPDVAFVPSALLVPSYTDADSPAADALLVALAARYRVVERSGATGLSVLVRAAAPAP